jgi:hypothetical protein
VLKSVGLQNHLLPSAVFQKIVSMCGPIQLDGKASGITPPLCPPYRLP